MPTITIISDDVLLGNSTYSRVPFRDDVLMLNEEPYRVRNVFLLDGSTKDVDALVSVEPFNSCKELHSPITLN
ncbi:hypothetical protein CEW91_07860 [Idiomarina piscisalsi]|uniref:Uncharacterized protein n=1 Tax=Idiomarina piscisalsi TaxID=1096243 RepID=A0ABN5AXN8_9GAMM|nr:hypothetical protein [Idiomarina piscisalsi]ASG66068.1 hypothetical protein CEW91_07860 [Idiomarina piscisalsi]